MPRRKKTYVLAVNNVDPTLWAQMGEFLQLHKRIPSNSQLGMVALETYLALANRYGIDKDWRIKLPGIPDSVYTTPSTSDPKPQPQPQPLEKGET